MPADQIRESRGSLNDKDIAKALDLCKDRTRYVALQMRSAALGLACQSLEMKLQQAMGDQRSSIMQALRDIRSHQSDAMEHYRDGLERLISKGGATLDTAPAASDKPGLSLIDTHVLEQQIVAERMSAQANAETQINFSQLNRRYCFLRNERIKPKDNPLGPWIQGQLMLAAVDRIPVEADVRVTILRAIEKHFTEYLSGLYAELNEHLVAMDVLPTIKHHIWRTDDSLRNGRGHSLAGLTESQREALANARRPTESEDIGEMLHKLLAGKGAGEEASGPHPAAPASPDDAASGKGDLGAAFRDQQRQTIQMIDSVSAEAPVSILAAVDAAAAADSLAKPDGATRKVLELAEKLSQEFMRPFLRDASSPQAAIARSLAAPLAKLAILDPGLLVEMDHPGRTAIKNLRAFSDFVEVADEGAAEAMLHEFTALAAQFEESALRSAEELADCAVDIADRVADLKQETKVNLLALKEYYRSLERYETVRQGALREIDNELQQMSIEDDLRRFIRGPWFDIQQHQLHWLDGDDDHLAELRKDARLLVEGLSQGANQARVVDELRRLTESGLTVAAGELRRLAGMQNAEGMVVADAPALASEGTDIFRDDMSTWLNKKLKSGSWVRVSAEGSSERASLCRLFGVYSAGRYCVVTDGLGLRAQELDAAAVSAMLDSGRMAVL